MESLGGELSDYHSNLLSHHQNLIKSFKVGQKCPQKQSSQQGVLKRRGTEPSWLTGQCLLPQIYTDRNGARRSQLGHLGPVWRDSDGPQRQTPTTRSTGLCWTIKGSVPQPSQSAIKCLTAAQSQPLLCTPQTDSLGPLGA